MAETQPDNTIAAIASALYDAERDRTPIAQPSAAHPELTVDDAYAIQTINTDRRVAAGERIIGRKIGLTSAAMQQQLKVNEPDFGVVTDRLVIPTGGTLSVGDLIAPRLEAEFAFVIGEDVPTDPTDERLRQAVTGIAVAIEVIDSRVADWEIALVDTVADNASCARIVVGPTRPATPERLRAIVDTTLVLSADGAELSSGPGSAVLGDPLRALGWLAAAIGRYDQSFRAGDVVLAGAVAAAVPLTPGTRFAVTADGFERVVLMTESAGS